MKALKDMNKRELKIHEIISHLNDISNRMDRMTSGNFMHNKAATKLSVNIIKARLKELGITEYE